MSASSTQDNQPSEIKTDNNQVSVHDPQSVWIVESGFVDLFYDSLIGDTLAGPRRHVLRATTGEAIFGFPADVRETIDRRFLLVRSMDADLRHVDIRRLQEPGPDGEPSPSATDALNRWIVKISLAVTPEVTPEGFTVLDAGDQVSVSNGRSVTCSRGVVWIRHRSGCSMFLGLSNAATIAGDPAFPLMCRTWVNAGEDSTLEGLSTAEVQRADQDGSSLAIFHRAIIAVLVAREAEEDVRERERFRAKKENGAWQVATALHTLANPLSGGRDFDLPRSANPLLSACQIVGSVLGIEMRAPTETGRRTVSNDSIADIARASNVRVRQVLLRGSWWTDDHGPLLGSWQDSKKPVALIARKLGGYEVIDPAEGTRTKLGPDIVAALDPYASVFYRSFPEKKLSYWDVLHFGLRGCGSDLWLIFVTGLAASLLALTLPFFAGMLFDSIIPGAKRHELIQLTVLLVVVSFATTLFDASRQLTLLRLEGRMGASIQAAVWDRLIRLPASFFRQFSAGDLADRANSIDQVRSALTGTLTNSVVAGTFSFLNFGLMLFFSWRLALVAVALITIGLTVDIWFGALQSRRVRSFKARSGRLSGELLQFVGGIAKFRVSGTEVRPFAVWSRGYSELMNAARLYRSAGNDLTTFHSFFHVLAQIVLFYSLARWQGQITTGEFFGFSTAFRGMFSGVMGLARAVAQVMAQVPVYQRALPILESQPEVDSGKANPGELTGTIEVSHLVLRYGPDSPVVLDDISIRITPGEFVALVGPSGCGKSTLLRALLGFEKAESGAVYFDGQDLRSLDVALVRRQTGVVLQNSILSRGDVFTNIIGSKPLTLEDAWEAARMAGLEQDIRRLPMGMHTIISEGGGGLSGGQRQRLMIARAIVSKPRILFFDEATSALDNQSQAIVSRSLEAMKSTRIVIAHRLSTIVNADQIYVLDAGRIVQHGTYPELIAQDGLFASLVQRQLT